MKKKYQNQLNASRADLTPLQGDRAAHGSIDQWRRSMRAIDAICKELSLFTNAPNLRINNLCYMGGIVMSLSGRL